MQDRSDQVIINEFGENLRRIRLGKGLTQPELAMRAEVSTNTVNRIELGVTEAGLTTIMKLAAGLGVEAGELFSFPR